MQAPQWLWFRRADHKEPRYKTQTCVSVRQLHLRLTQSQSPTMSTSANLPALNAELASAVTSASATMPIHTLSATEPATAESTSPKLKRITHLPRETHEALFDKWLDIETGFKSAYAGVVEAQIAIQPLPAAGRSFPEHHLLRTIKDLEQINLLGKSLFWECVAHLK